MELTVLLRGIFALMLLCVAAGPGRAQQYPSKPVRLVVGFPPGGAADFVARTLGEPLGGALRQPIVIENRPGAGSSIAAEHVARSAPDGYTVLLASPSNIVISRVLNPQLGYDPETDLRPVARLTSAPLVVAVFPGLGVKTVRELIAAAKAAPGRLNYASSGNGSVPHLAAVLFTRVAGVDIVHVPFRGGAPALQSVVAGAAHVAFATPPSVLPHIQSGRLRALAVTSRARSVLLPDIQSMAEAGLAGYDLSFWYGLFVRAGTPEAIVKALFDATAIALRAPKVSEMLAREGTEIAATPSPAAFAAFLSGDLPLWEKLVRESGAKID